MRVTLQRASILLLSLVLLCAVCLVYFSFTTFNSLAKIQDLVTRLNHSVQDPAMQSDSVQQSNMLLEFEGLHEKLPWDADLGSMLITVINNQAIRSSNVGMQQALISKSQDFYQQSLSFRPRDIQLLSGQLDLLIDQGAPAQYILPKLNRIITYVPKDQDLKAELAMICFKLLALNPSSDVQFEIIESLKSLFDYSMDYRGLIFVRRYATLYGQQDVLKDVLSSLN